jgi:hypothetical protein
MCRIGLRGLGGWRDQRRGEWRGAARTLLAASMLVVGCGGGEEVTSQSIAAARALWNRAGIRDYELEWTASGMTDSHYVVTVRAGEVRKVEAVARDGQRFELKPPEPRFYGVEGLFTTIADELAQLKTDRPFGQPKGTAVVMRFTPDPKLGYPRWYRRDVMGTPQNLRLDVIRLTPAAAIPAASSPEGATPTVPGRSAAALGRGNLPLLAAFAAAAAANLAPPGNPRDDPRPRLWLDWWPRSCESLGESQRAIDRSGARNGKRAESASRGDLEAGGNGGF